jgi:ketosteroid isomerase-like protein
MVSMTNEDVAEQIRALENRRYEAVTAGDVATLDELFAADLVYTHSDATADSKQSYLERLAAGFFKYGPISHPEIAIVVRGDCALVFHDMRGEVRIDGLLRVLNSRSLAVWGREDGGWRLLAFQPTKYPS